MRRTWRGHRFQVTEHQRREHQRNTAKPANGLTPGTVPDQVVAIQADHIGNIDEAPSTQRGGRAKGVAKGSTREKHFHRGGVDAGHQDAGSTPPYRSTGRCCQQDRPLAGLRLIHHLGRQQRATTPALNSDDYRTTLRGGTGGQTSENDIWAGAGRDAASPSSKICSLCVTRPNIAARNTFHLL